MNKDNEFDFIDISEGESASSQGEVEMDIIMDDISFDEDALSQVGNEQSTLNNQVTEENASNIPNGTSQQSQISSSTNSGNGENALANNSETSHNSEDSSPQTGSDESNSSQNSNEPSSEMPQGFNDREDSEPENENMNQNGQGDSKKTNKGQGKKVDEKKSDEKKPDDKKDPNKKDENDNKNNQDRKDEQNKDDQNKSDKNSNNQDNKQQDKQKDEQNKIDNNSNNKQNNIDKKTEDNKKDENDNKNNESNKKSEDKKNDSNAADKKRQEAKEKMNRQKNVSNQANSKNKMPNNKKPGKPNAKNIATKIAKDKLQENETAQKALQAVDIILNLKKINPIVIKGILILACICIIIFLVAFIAAAVTTALTPGTRGDVKDDYNYSKHTEIDKETLEDMKEIYAVAPDADTPLALATVLYPYYSNLHGGNVTSLLGSLGEEENNEEMIEGDEFSDNDDNSEDENGVTDDIYLIPFRNSKVKKRLKKLLKNMGNEGDNTTFENYVKNTYFKSDGGFSKHYNEEALTGYNGYKNMFDALANDSDEEALKDAIIKDLYAIKDMFVNYVFEDVVCISNLTDAGTIDASDLLKGNVLVDLKKPGCSSLSMCSESYYDTYLTLEEYVKGVVYEEISGEENLNKIAAQMVAAKTFTLSRRTDKITTDPNTGAYVIPMLWSTADQDFCHVEKGCNSFDIQERNGYNRPSNYSKPEQLFHGANRPPASDELKALYEEVWELTKNVYVVNSDGTPAVTSYYQGTSCTPGTCMDQSKLVNYENNSFDSILAYFYSEYSIATVDGDFATVQVSSSTTCSSSSKTYGGISDDDFKFYYQTDYAASPFCGATNYTNSCDSGSNSICSSGCGVTSFAMLIENLSTGDVVFNPIDANEEAKLNGGCEVGGGSNDSLFNQIGEKHSGFSAAYLTNDSAGASKVIETIKNGGLVAANVQHISPFTTAGHWILIRGITEDGKVKVADPNSKDRSSIGIYDINEFIDKNWLVDKNGTTHSWIAIYGPRSEEIKNQFIESNSTSGEMIDDETALKADFVAPVQDSSLKMYGKNETNGNTNHDLAASCGTAVYSPADGTATFKTVLLNSKIAGYGNEVEIVTDDGYRFVLSHLKSFVGYNVLYGSSSTYPSSCIGKNCSTHEYGSRKVSKGEKIGESGTSGNSTGCHLHIELYQNGTRLEPSRYLGYQGG